MTNRHICTTDFQEESRQFIEYLLVALRVLDSICYIKLTGAHVNTAWAGGISMRNCYDSRFNPQDQTSESRKVVEPKLNRQQPSWPMPSSRCSLHFLNVLTQVGNKARIWRDKNRLLMLGNSLDRHGNFWWPAPGLKPVKEYLTFAYSAPSHRKPGTELTVAINLQFPKQCLTMRAFFPKVLSCFASISGCLASLKLSSSY